MSLFKVLLITLAIVSFPLFAQDPQDKVETVRPTYPEIQENFSKQITAIRITQFSSIDNADITKSLIEKLDDSALSQSFKALVNSLNTKERKLLSTNGFYPANVRIRPNQKRMIEGEKKVKAGYFASKMENLEKGQSITFEMTSDWEISKSEEKGFEFKEGNPLFYNTIDTEGLELFREALDIKNEGKLLLAKSEVTTVMVQFTLSSSKEDGKVSVKVIKLLALPNNMNFIKSENGVVLTAIKTNEHTSIGTIGEEADFAPRHRNVTVTKN